MHLESLDQMEFKWGSTCRATLWRPPRRNHRLRPRRRPTVYLQPPTQHGLERQRQTHRQSAQTGLEVRQTLTEDRTLTNGSHSKISISASFRSNSCSSISANSRSNWSSGCRSRIIGSICSSTLPCKLSDRLIWMSLALSACKSERERERARERDRWEHWSTPIRHAGCPG